MPIEEMTNRKPQPPVCNGTLGPRRYRATATDRLAQYEAELNARIAANHAWDRDCDELPWGGA
jgi:hypothetical protein